MPLIKEKKQIQVEGNCVTFMCDAVGCSEIRSLESDWIGPDVHWNAPTGWTKAVVSVKPTHGDKYQEAFFFCPNHTVGRLLVPA